MTDDRSIAKPEAWYGVIQAAAREHATTAEVWGAIRDYADAQGLSVPSNMFSEVNRMRATATGLTLASERLGRMSEGDAITSEAIGTQIYQRGADELNKIAALYHVRFEMITQTLAGEQSTAWYTLDYGPALPATVGELQDDLDAYGGGLTDSYGQTFVGIGRVEIGAY